MHNASKQSPPELFGLNTGQVWDTGLAFSHLQAMGLADTKRTAERRLQTLGLLPAALDAANLLDEFGRAPNPLVLNWATEHARSKRKRVLFLQLATLPNGQPCLHANDPRGARFWLPLMEAPCVATLGTILQRLHAHIGTPIAVFAHGELVRSMRQAPSGPEITVTPQVYQASPVTSHAQPGGPKNRVPTSPHLKRLEAESIHILREAVAEAQNPVMLYSIGKDSGVMLHLARKAFYPAPLPFALLHVDTRWKFQEMYLFRDFITREFGLDLRVHTNPEAIEKNINPFDHGSALHTDITKTEGLKQALDQHQFDVIFGGARRDEEKSRAKERVFSFRSTTHGWNPKNQRPELWNLYNAKKSPGESIRVFPLSNWTELDIWHYIYQENIPVAVVLCQTPARGGAQRHDHDGG
jgi:sulfate adenylyltransferase subunit 2